MGAVLGQAESGDRALGKLAPGSATRRRIRDRFDGQQPLGALHRGPQRGRRLRVDHVPLGDDTVDKARRLGRDPALHNVVHDQIGIPFQGVAEPAAAGAAHDHDVVAPEGEALNLPGRIGGRQFRAVPDDREVVGCARPARGDPEGREDVLVGGHRKQCVLDEHADVAAQAAASAMPTGTAGIAPDFAALDQQRAFVLDRLDRLYRREVALGEVAQGVAAVAFGGRARAARGVFVEDEGLGAVRVLSADIDVVRRALDVARHAFRHGPAHGAENRRNGGVPNLGRSRAGGGIARIEEGPFRRGDRDRSEIPVVDGLGRIQERLEHDERAGRGNRGTGVHRRARLAGGAGEVDLDVAPVDSDPRPRDHGFRVGADGVQVVLVDVVAVCQRFDALPGPALGPVDQLGDGRLDGGDAVALEQLGNAPFGDLACPPGRHEVAAPFARHAHVGHHHVEQALVEHAAAGDLHDRQAHAVVEDLRRLAGNAARCGAADVAPMRADGREQDQTPLREDRKHHGDVVEMGSPGIGIVVEEDVARSDILAEGVEHPLDRPRHRKDVGRVSSASATICPWPSISTQEKSWAS